jgi:hypothetical protein
VADGPGEGDAGRVVEGVSDRVALLPLVVVVVARPVAVDLRRYSVEYVASRSKKSRASFSL